MSRPLSEDEAIIHTRVVVSCNENRREVSATQRIAGKHIDRHFAFDKDATIEHLLPIFLSLLKDEFLGVHLNITRPRIRFVTTDLPTYAQWLQGYWDLIYLHNPCCQLL